MAEIKKTKYYHSVVDHPELLKWELLKYQKFIKSHGNLVDLGCGRGTFLLMAKKYFKSVMGVDLNPDAVRLCKQKKIPVVLANALKTKLKSGSFDVVRAMNVLEHVSDMARLIMETKRLLKKDGILVLHVPTQWSIIYPVTNFYDDYTHTNPISKHGLERLMNDTGFKILYLTSYTVGRNFLEKIICRIVNMVIPYSWFMIAKKEE